jgi:hypothetical protein
MKQQFIRWLGSRFFPGQTQTSDNLRSTGVRVRRPAERVQTIAKAKPVPKPAFRYESEIGGKIEDGGPGKNILVRSKYVREETGTHEVLKIIDESLVDGEPDGGIDPYNTGRFDRSKSWNSRYRK